MARYKHIDTSPRFIAIDLQKQLLPGTFEHALNHLIDHVLDLTRFDTRYNNDLTGASAYPPAMLQRHREADQQDLEPDLQAKEQQRIASLEKEAAKMHQWLSKHPEDRKGSKGKPRQSNRTDNDSAKMATSKGVIQGYTGVAAVDAKHQIIVEAQAHGTGSEQELLIPVVAALQVAEIMTGETLITADAGYHSEANLKALDKMEVDALIADNRMRSRDERFAEQDKHKASPVTLTTMRIKAPASVPQANSSTAMAATVSSMVTLR